MTLSLYNLHEGNVENVFCWVPDEPQWWITGFNTDFTEPDPDTMSMVCSVDFSSNEEMYKKLQNSNRIEGTAELIFDDLYYTVWIVW